MFPTKQEDPTYINLDYKFLFQIDIQYLILPFFRKCYRKILNNV